MDHNQIGPDSALTNQAGDLAGFNRQFSRHLISAATMFEDVYAEMPRHLESQRRRLMEILAEE